MEHPEFWTAPRNKNTLVAPYEPWRGLSPREVTRGLSHSRLYYLECQFRGLQELSGVVVCNPQIKGGVPVMRGTRFTASQVIAEIAESDAVAEVGHNLSLSKDDVTGLLNGISLLLMQPRE